MNIVKKYVGKGKRKTTIGMEREQTTSEYEKAIQYIDQLIQQGDLRIGSKLPTERAIAEELGIGEVYSELLPADKVAKVEQLLSQKS